MSITVAELLAAGGECPYHDYGKCVFCGWWDGEGGFRHYDDCIWLRAMREQGHVETGGTEATLEAIRAQEGKLLAERDIPNGVVRCGDCGYVKTYTNNMVAYRMCMCGLMHSLELA